jgi:TetR/AcrR family transcriptional repressor of nem operon
LSERHLTDIADGCVVAALAPEIARQGAAARRGLTDYVRVQIERLTRLLGRDSTERRRRRAIATLAGMVGALTLARAVDDTAFSNEILAAAREAFGEKTKASA